MQYYNKKIIFYLLISRISFLLLSFIVSNIIVYDHSTKLLNISYFSNLIRWDAIYFYDISINGYTTIQQSAFFPLYPLLIRYINIFNNTALTGIIFSNILFIFNGLLLYNLLSNYFKKIALEKYIIVYCFYPSTIINSSFYSESLFFFLFLISLILFKYNYLISYIIIIINCLTRSNGILFSFIPLFLSNSFIKFIEFPILVILCKIIIDLYQIYIYKIFNIKNCYYFVQTNIWNQGFLRFYNFIEFPENIFNLFIGLPFIYIITSYNLKYYNDINIKKTSLTTFLSFLLFIQTIILLLFFHLQIFMRFVSTNPFTYFLIILYGKTFIKFSIFYSIWYSILFSCYYPPT